MRRILAVAVLAMAIAACGTEGPTTGTTVPTNAADGAVGAPTGTAGTGPVVAGDVGPGLP